jgi:hypothetical protein
MDRTLAFAIEPGADGLVVRMKVEKIIVGYMPLQSTARTGLCGSARRIESLRDHQPLTEVPSHSEERCAVDRFSVLR